MANAAIMLVMVVRTALNFAPIMLLLINPPALIWTVVSKMWAVLIMANTAIMLNVIFRTSIYSTLRISKRVFENISIIIDWLIPWMWTIVGKMWAILFSAVVAIMPSVFLWTISHPAHADSRSERDKFILI